MARKKKVVEQVEEQNSTTAIEEAKEPVQDTFMDDFFINLTMDWDNRDDEIYPKWAAWCAKSEGRYRISSKDGHFFTEERDENQIAIEEKRIEMTNFLVSQEIRDDDPLWLEYNSTMQDNINDNEKLLTMIPITYEEWLKQRK